MAENIAEQMSEAMREVSVAEFFEKNRHLLGYENPTKALITVVKELLDNSLDAANEADMLPDIKINVEQKKTEVKSEEYLFSWSKVPGDDERNLRNFLKKQFNLDWIENAKITNDGEKIRLFSDKNWIELSIGRKKEKVIVNTSNKKTFKLKIKTEANELIVYQLITNEVLEDKFKVTIVDNGPGIREDKVPYAFGKLLYGSKFYRLRQSRGIQGLGGHGAVLYSQLTTGKSAKITTSLGKKIHYFEIMIDVEKNEPQVIVHETRDNPDGWHGLKLELELEGRYIEGKQSITEYVEQTHMANPYASITFEGPNGKVVYKRLISEMPKQPVEIKPHPYGVELGVLRRMINATNTKNIATFFAKEFSRVGKGSALQILKAAGVDPKKKPQDVLHEETERIHKAIQRVKLIAPPTDCLSPLGEKLMEKGLKKDTGAEFVAAVTRPPSVYRGNPFLVEVAMGYGGSIPADQTAQLFRFANKVPLLYHQSDCVIADATKEVDFRRYGLSQPSSSLPVGPLVILVHFASVWVPFTSEGKQAIANYPEILKEIKLAIQDAGRELGSYVRHQVKQREIRLRKELFEKYVPELAESLAKLTDKSKEKIIRDLEKIIRDKDTKKIAGGEGEKTGAAEKEVKNEGEKKEGELNEKGNEKGTGSEKEPEEAGQ